MNVASSESDLNGSYHKLLSSYLLTMSKRTSQTGVLWGLFFFFSPNDPRTKIFLNR